MSIAVAAGIASIEVKGLLDLRMFVDDPACTGANISSHHELGAYKRP
jgi:hypothetical protein